MLCHSDVVYSTLLYDIRHNIILWVILHVVICCSSNLISSCLASVLTNTQRYLCEIGCVDEVFWAGLPLCGRVRFVMCCAFATGRVGFKDCTVIDDVRPYPSEDYALLDEVILKVRQFFPEFSEDRLSQQYMAWHKLALQFSLLLLTQDDRSRVSVWNLIEERFDFD